MEKPPRRPHDGPMQMDLFTAVLVDARLRDERDVMEFPLFSLEKRKRTKAIHYARHGVEVLVSGSPDYGIATIWDADFLIYVVSQWNAAIDKGLPVSRRVWVTPHHFMLQTGRAKRIGGKLYRDFEAALDRLKTTSVKANIPIEGTGRVYKEHWSWIDRWQGNKDERGRLTGVEVEVSEWLFERVARDRAVLSISSDYFLLTGGIERWLYRLARKVVGRNARFTIPVAELHARYPSGPTLRRFRSDLKRLVEESEIPEYAMLYLEHRQEVEFHRKDKLPRILL